MKTLDKSFYSCRLNNQYHEFHAILISNLPLCSSDELHGVSVKVYTLLKFRKIGVLSEVFMIMPDLLKSPMSTHKSA